MDLTSVPVADLVNELLNRTGVQKIAVGLYQPYDLQKKYVNGSEREPVDSNCVLIVDHFDA